MYCPRCSQHQVSDDISFCTRCGFQLGVVKELLVTGGVLPTQEIVSQAGQLLPRQKGIRLGIKLIFFSIMSLPLFFVLSYRFDSPIPFWVPAVISLAGLGAILYSNIFSEDILPSKQEAPSAFSANGIDTPTLTAPSVAYVRKPSAIRVNTAEMVQPPSITESTTRQLRTIEE